MARTKKTWTAGAYMHDGISWTLIAGRGERVSEVDARAALPFVETEAKFLGGIAELRENGALIAEYRSPEYRPGGRLYDRTL